MHKHTMMLGLLMGLGIAGGAHAQDTGPTACTDSRVSTGLNVCFDGATGTF